MPQGTSSIWTQEDQIDGAGTDALGLQRMKRLGLIDDVLERDCVSQELVVDDCLFLIDRIVGSKMTGTYRTRGAPRSCVVVRSWTPPYGPCTATVKQDYLQVWEEFQPSGFGKVNRRLRCIQQKINGERRYANNNGSRQTGRVKKYHSPQAVQFPLMGSKE